MNGIFIATLALHSAVWRALQVAERLRREFLLEIPVSESTMMANYDAWSDKASGIKKLKGNWWKFYCA